jgi:glycosyltransferase involved in cell wall biosynthesis
MRVAGISMVRNEVEVIDFTVRHHLDQGLDPVVILDNGSTDGTLEILREIEKKDERVTVLVDDGPFHQEVGLTMLAQEALKLGATWMVAFDGDELWASTNGLVNDIRNTGGANLIYVTLQNFVQATNYSPNHLYSNVLYKIPNDQANATKEEIERKERSSIELPWGRKHIIKLSENLLVGPGTHIHTGLPIGHTHIDESNTFKAYQVPMRSYEHLVRKAENGMRIQEAGYGYEYGWEAHIWADQYRSGTLMDEWKANSHHLGVMTRYDGSQLQLEYNSLIADQYDKYLGSKI